MRVFSTLLRRKIPLLATASATAALGMVAIVPLTAQAATPSASAALMSAKPIFTIWKPGTRLPRVPAGYTLIVWSSDKVMRGMTKGATVPTKTMNAAQAATFAATSASYRAWENEAGLVNLEIAPAPTSATGAACIYSNPRLVQDGGSIVTSVMQSYSNIIEADQYFYYGNGQSSSLGVGVSVSGAAGSFTASGDNSVSTNSVQEFAIQYNKSYNHFETWFEVGNFFVENSCPELNYYIVMQYKWNAGTNCYHPPGAPSATHCTVEHPNDHFIKSTTTASTFTIGYSSPIFGFSGEATTGYSNTASIRFGFDQDTHLCGVNDTPPNDPGALVANP